MEIRKIKVLVLKEYIDRVLSALYESGCLQLIDLKERVDSFKENFNLDVLYPVFKQTSQVLSAIHPNEKGIERLTRHLVDHPADYKTLLSASLREDESTLAAYAQKVDVTPSRRYVSTFVPYEEPRELLQQGVVLQSRITNSITTINDLLEDDEAEGKTSEQILPVPDQESAELLVKSQGRLEEIEGYLTVKKETLAEIQAKHQGFQQRKKRQELLKELLTQIEGAEKAILGAKLSEFTDLDDQAPVIEDQLVQHKTELVKVREELSLMKAVIQREQIIGEAKSNMLRTAKTVYFEAYILSTELQSVTTIIQDTSNENCQISHERPSHDEAAPSTGRLAPGFMIAFEKLTLASGYPASSEVNPIPVMAITFPLLFGIMFADVGQGLILALLGVTLSIVRRRVSYEEMGDILRYVLLSGEMFVFMGIAGIGFGFLFGEFFGASGILHPIALGRIGPFYIGGFEPTQEPMKMLKFAILVGVLHLSLGLVLRIVNEVKKQRYQFIPVSICWLWLLYGGLTMWAYWGGISSISSWFAEGILMLLGLIILPLVLIMVVTGLVETFTEGIGFGVEVFAETLSHTLSYGRLMALGLVHSVLNNLFLVLGGVEHGVFPLSSIPIIAIGTILVMTVEGLIVFVHTLRLHWIEWFSKFFSGEGIPFKPNLIHNHTK